MCTHERTSKAAEVCVSHTRRFRNARVQRPHLMSVFPRAETPEIFCGFGTGVLEKLHLDAARRCPSDGHVEKHDRVSSCNRLFSKMDRYHSCVKRETGKSTCLLSDGQQDEVWCRSVPTEKAGVLHGCCNTAFRCPSVIWYRCCCSGVIVYFVYSLRLRLYSLDYI